MKSALFLFLILIPGIFANTEKLILHARSSNVIPCESQFLKLSKVKSAPFLYPPFSEVQDSLIPSSPSVKPSIQWHNLDGLKDGSNYEIRISYPAITPADFQLKIINSCRKDNEDLLYVLQVSAQYTGVSQVQGMESRPVTYNLVLETLYLGFLFYQVYKIVIAIVIMLFIGQVIFITRIKKLIAKLASSSDNKMD